MTMTEKILIIIELLAAAAFLAAFPVLNAGNAAGLAVCAAALIITADVFGARTTLASAWHGGGAARAALAAAGALIFAGCVLAAVLSVKMVGGMNNAPEAEPRLIVVLGCQVRGERPSRMLARRLDIAYDAMQRYPGAKVVVSGGKGSDEAISEGECMTRYLIEKGADPARIIKEDTSTTTYENIRNTFAITDALGLGRDITLVTDGYHQYRASLIAKKCGAGEVRAISANTEKRFIPTYWVREWMAIVLAAIR